MSEMRYEVRGKLLVLPYWMWLFESTGFFPPSSSSFKQSWKNVVIKFVRLLGEHLVFRVMVKSVRCG